MAVYKSKRRGVNRGRTSKIRRIVKRGGQKIAKIARSVVQKAMARNIETKQSCRTIATTNVLHNKISIIDSQLLTTTQGTGDPMVVNVANRIGDEISLRGISIRFVMELPIIHSDVTYRTMIIRSAKGDTPNINTLFYGLSDCKLIDQINTERFSVLYSKTFKMTARNQGLGNLITASELQRLGVGGPSTGISVLRANGFSDAPTNDPVNTYNTQSLGNATRICKMWIPGTKFVRNGVLKYENGTAQAKFFDYHFIAYGYANANTNVDPSYSIPVGVLKHHIVQMYYKDA